MTVSPRTARLVLVTPDGAVVGSLPAVPVATPWWQDVAPIVQAVRERHGVEVTILRLLGAVREEPPGGEVTYLAEVPHAVPAVPWHGTLDEHPLRQAYARPGGPAADLRWAESVLSARGLPVVGRPEQLRSWNLSSLWRIPVEGQQVWLKVVPPFFAHEGALLARLAGEQVPTVLGHEAGRTLLANIAGEDQYDAALPQLLAMVTLLVDLQRAWRGRTGELLSLGLPDWRPPALSAAIAEVIERTKDELSADERAILAGFVQDLPGRFAEVAACGLGDTLVHGDFHPGNVRGEGLALTMLDWGDAGIGHPLLDQPAFLERVPASALETVCEHWTRCWVDALPDADPARAARLLAPIAAARQAVTYRHFLDNVEPAEHPYHRSDPALWLRSAVALLHRP